MSVIKEFKEFAIKGNLIETAVAFIMGAAFGKVTTSFIEGIMMPLVSMVMPGGGNFATSRIVLSEAKLDEAGKIVAPEVAIKYGEFLTYSIDFLAVAFFMFMLIKTINKLRQEKTGA